MECGAAAAGGDNLKDVAPRHGIHHGLYIMVTVRTLFENIEPDVYFSVWKYYHVYN